MIFAKEVRSWQSPYKGLRPIRSFMLRDSWRARFRSPMGLGLLKNDLTRKTSQISDEQN
jgi:hypothetical protein